MEIMSTLHLLVCALAVALPEVLGVPSARFSEIKLNNSLMMKQKQPTHKILLNINGPPLVKAVTELQSAFKDISCRNCTTCMENAIKAYRIHSHIISYQPDAQELYYDVLNNERRKRNTASNDWQTKIEEGKSVMATVTKYAKDKKVYAVKIKEMNENDGENCKVYSVKKSVSCDVGSIIISASKRTAKKTKRMKEPVTTSTTTESFKLITSSYKKREVDNSHVSDSFMPSIEDLY